MVNITKNNKDVITLEALILKLGQVPRICLKTHKAYFDCPEYLKAMSYAYEDGKLNEFLKNSPIYYRGIVFDLETREIYCHHKFTNDLENIFCEDENSKKTLEIQGKYKTIVPEKISKCVI